MRLLNATLGFIAAVCLPSLAAATADAPHAVSGAQLEFALVNQLDQLEPWVDAQTFYAGVLWTGRSVVHFQNENHVEVYAPATHALLGSVQLPHDVQSVRPYGPNSVLVLGKTANPYFVDYYSVVTWNAATARLTAQTRYFPMEFSPTYYVGDYARGLKYFMDVGNGGAFIADSNADTLVTLPFSGAVPTDPDAGFPANPDRPWRAPRHPTEPGGEIPGVEAPFDSPDFLTPRLHGPGHAVMVGDYAFIVENLNGSGTQSDVARLNVKTETIDWPSSLIWGGLRNLTYLPVTDWVVAADRATNKLLFINPATGQLRHEVQLPGAAGDVWDVAPFGHCVAVLSALSTQVTFLDTRTEPAQALATWDLSSYIDRFHRPRALVADVASGSVFVRSDEICPSSNCSTSFNDTRAAREVSGWTQAACTN